MTKKDTKKKHAHPGARVFPPPLPKPGAGTGVLKTTTRAMRAGILPQTGRGRPFPPR